MKISAKGVYALASSVCLAESFLSGDYIPLITISERLGISKIYLEQVFSLLKRSGTVESIKGAQGGYRLSRSPNNITALDVLSAVELSLLGRTESGVGEKVPELADSLTELVFQKADQAVTDSLSAVTLDMLVNDIKKRRAEKAPMFYI